ncbi:MAG: insulinase family protein [candidate division Zixibacteria bacterium]|nr:insulinase family protein [Candidatus Tariuqbacter arcticus]
MRKASAVILMMFLSTIVFAQMEKDIGSEFLENLNVEEHSLDNGLKILTLEDHSAPIVSFQMWVHTGSRNERQGITGISHLFEHMMFKGSKKYGPEEHATIIKKNGGWCNAFTAQDVTVFFENIVPDKLELVISLEAERLANLALTQETLSSEREVVKEERRYRIDDDNFGSLHEQLLATAYNAHSYGWHIVGWMSDIDAITLEDCREYHRIHYAPNNITLAIVGDFDTKKALKMVKKYYGKIPAQEPPPPVSTVEPPQKGERIAYVKRMAQLPMLFAGYHIPEMIHEDIPPLQVMQKILSDGRSSRLYKRLVYEEQVALYAGGFVDELEDPGLFNVYCAMNAGHEIDEGKRLLFEEIERFAKEEVSDKELQKAMNQLEADFVFGLQTNMRKGLSIADYAVRAGDYKKIVEAYKKLQSVTKEDIMRVAEEYLVEDNRTVIILVPEEI